MERSYRHTEICCDSLCFQAASKGKRRMSRVSSTSGTPKRRHGRVGWCRERCVGQPIMSYDKTLKVHHRGRCWPWLAKRKSRGAEARRKMVQQGTADNQNTRERVGNRVADRTVNTRDGTDGLDAIKDSQAQCQPTTTSFRKQTTVRACSGTDPSTATKNRCVTGTVLLSTRTI